jgi:cyclin D3
MASPHPSFPQHHHHHHQEEEESSAQKNPAFLLDDLYCSEEHWEEEEEEEAREDYLQEDDYYYPRNTHKPDPFPVLLEQDLFWEDEELISLFSKEQQNELYGSIKTDPYLAGDRREAVEWMLKVNACYSFSALTAVLAVNYLDRFLLAGFRGDRARGERTKPWMIQLASVACLSLAAKVEETHVPLLLDFQVLTL